VHSRFTGSHTSTFSPYTTLFRSELQDIMPTLLDAADVSIPDTVDGRSVLPLARGESIGWRGYIHGEHARGAESHQFLTNGREKYIWHSQTGEEQYFDLSKDPKEKLNLAGALAYSETGEMWSARLFDELTGH